MEDRLASSRSNDSTIAIVGLFWVAFYGIVTAVDHLAAATAILFLPRALISFSGLIISLALARLRLRRFPAAAPWRIAMLLTFAILGGALQVFANYAIFHLFAPEMRPVITLTVYLADLVHWFWIYAAQLGIIFALDHSREASERERRIAMLDGMAHQAQLRALRYQLNPHFMFNTLNSIAALIGRGDTADAEHMVEDLADFLRTTLAIEPNADVTLAQELELQARYLAIETRRFPNRLRVVTRICDAAAHARVPGLITQPLTENVIRHAVAASETEILMTVAGRRVGDDLEITVTNTPGSGAAPLPGTGVGLANVAERLIARFRDRSSFAAGPQPDGGYSATMRMPYIS